MTCFALSPDDSQLVSASRGLLMVQWDPQTQTPSRTWKSAHQLPVEVMTFDSTSTLLASGGADGTVKIYDMVSLLMKMVSLLLKMVSWLIEMVGWLIEMVSF